MGLEVKGNFWISQDQGPRAGGKMESHLTKGQTKSEDVGCRGERQIPPEGRANLMGLFRKHQIARSRFGNHTAILQVWSQTSITGQPVRNANYQVSPETHSI